MKRERVEEIVEAYCRDLELEKDLKRLMLLMAYDIERETRQGCVSKAYNLANELANSK